jgi:hypothetical protein
MSRGLGGLSFRGTKRTSKRKRCQATVCVLPVRLAKMQVKSFDDACLRFRAVVSPYLSVGFLWCLEEILR